MKSSPNHKIIYKKFYYRMNACLIVFIIFIGFAFQYQTIYAQEIPDSKGTDFWLTYMPNYHNNRFESDNKKKYGDSLYIFITADEPTSGMIEYRDNSGQSYTHNFNLPDITNIYVFKTSYYDFELNGFNNSGQLLNRGQCERIAPQSFHLTSEKDVTVYAHSQSVMTSEAFIVLPTDALGDEYFILTYDSDGDGDAMSGIYGGSTPSQFSIVAIEDSTDVFIEPSSATHINGMNIQYIQMNRGDVYLVQSKIDLSDLHRDLSGSHIRSNKAIAVFSGHQRSSIPIQGSGNPSRDILIEQMPPLKSWGKNAILVPYPQPAGVQSEGTDLFRILAAYDNTDVFVNDALWITLKRGQYIESQLTEAAFVKATAPILVTQYKKTSNSSTMETRDISDPFMMIIPQVEQFGNFYRCINVQAWDYNKIPNTLTKVYDEQWITIVAPNSTLNTVMVDGSFVPVSNFKSVPNSNYSYIWHRVGDGTHTVAASEGIGIYVYGYGIANSYGYFGGMNFKKLDFRPPEITGNPKCFEIQGAIYDSSANDSRILSVTVPIANQTNVTVDIEIFTPVVPKVSFSARLNNKFLDGEFEIVALDADSLQSRKKFEIPGFTVNVVNNKDTGIIPLINEVKRINKKYYYPVPIQNYGKFPRTIDRSVFTNGSGKFTIETTFPRTIQPGDIDTLLVSFMSDTEGIFIDSLSIGDECINRKIYAFNIQTKSDQDKPKIIYKADTCKTNFAITFTESQISDFGLKSVSILDSENCRITIDTFNIRKVTINIIIIDPYQDAYYKVKAVDSVGYETEFEEFIPGFTISLEPLEAPDNKLFMGEHKIGTLECDTIIIKNYGKERKVFRNEGLYFNILFSVPPSQYPIIIEPGESKSLLVCFHPIHKSTQPYYDTLYFKYNCLVKQITLEGMALGIEDESKTRCNFPVKLVMGSVHPEFSLNQVYPNPVTNTTKAQFSIPNKSDVQLYIINSTGEKLSTLINEKLDSGSYEIEFSADELPQGLYFIILMCPEGKLIRAFMVEK